MRIAVPIWEDRISPVFDTASRLLIVEMEDQKETSRFEILLDEQDIPRRCLRIKGLDVDILICGAISRHFFSMLISSGMNIIPGISGHSEEVLTAYFEGILDHDRFLMPGFKRNKFGRINGFSACGKPCGTMKKKTGYGRKK